MGWESKSGTNCLCQALSVSLKINLVFIQSIKEIHMYSFWPIPLPEVGGSKIWLPRCCRPEELSLNVKTQPTGNPPSPTSVPSRFRFLCWTLERCKGSWDRRKNGNREFSLSLPFVPCDRCEAFPWSFALVTKKNAWVQGSTLTLFNPSSIFVKFCNFHGNNNYKKVIKNKFLV